MNKITVLKKRILFSALLINTIIFGQVGINTTNPTKLLDINISGSSPNGINIQNGTEDSQILSQFVGLTHTLTINNSQNTGIYKFQFAANDRFTFTQNGFYPAVNATNNTVTGALDIGMFNRHFRRVYSQAIHTNDNTIDGGLGISIGSSGGTVADYKFSDFALYPLLSGIKDLGRNGNFWRNFYFVNAFTPSDRRLKNNIKELSQGLSTILDINTYQYHYNFDKDNALHFGFMAQEIKKMLPHLVSTGDDEAETLSINYNEFIPILTKALQEQNQVITEQNLRIKELENKMNMILNATSKDK